MKLLLLVLLATPMFSQKPSLGFRNDLIGETLTAFQSHHPDASCKIDSQNGTLGCNLTESVTVAGVAISSVSYFFYENNLYWIELIAAPGTTGDSTKAAYRNLVSAYSAKYGDPTGRINETESVWSSQKLPTLGGKGLTVLDALTAWGEPRVSLNVSIRITNLFITTVDISDGFTLVLTQALFEAAERAAKAKDL